MNGVIYYNSKCHPEYHDHSSVDLAGNMLVVLGQAVRVSDLTSFDDSFANPSLAGISPGDIVEVSGLRDSDGIIDATRIEPKPSLSPT